MGILYKGYCYDGIVSVSQALLSEGIVQTSIGAATLQSVQVVPSTDQIDGYILDTVRYTLQLTTLDLSGDQQHIHLDLQGYLPVCSSPGSFTGQFQLSQLQPLSIVSAFSSGASLVFPLFALSWACALLLNTITGKR